MAERDIRRYSAAELERMTSRGDYVPTRADAPEIEPGEDFWRHAKVVVPPGKTYQAAEEAPTGTYRQFAYGNSKKRHQDRNL